MINLKTPLGRLRMVAFVEGLSFLAILFITMPCKYFLQNPIPNKICGMLHGVLFIWYVFAIIECKITYGWSIRKFVVAFVASIIPCGTFWADEKLFDTQNT